VSANITKCNLLVGDRPLPPQTRVPSAVPTSNITKCRNHTLVSYITVIANKNKGNFNQLANITKCRNHTLVSYRNSYSEWKQRKLQSPRYQQRSPIYLLWIPLRSHPSRHKINKKNHWMTEHTERLKENESSYWIRKWIDIYSSIRNWGLKENEYLKLKTELTEREKLTEERLKIKTNLRNRDWSMKDWD
jgi:hypothetical protein